MHINHGNARAAGVLGFEEDGGFYLLHRYCSSISLHIAPYAFHICHTTQAPPGNSCSWGQLLESYHLTMREARADGFSVCLQHA